MKQKDDISQTDEPSSIVAGAVDKGRFAGVSKKRLMFLSGIFVLALLLLAGGVYYINLKRHQVKPLTLQQTVSNSRASVGQKQYDAAAKTLQDSIKNSKSDADRYRLSMELSTVYMNKKDFANAQIWLQQAQKYKGGKIDFGTAYSQAQTAAALGDKAAAIGYYKQALSLIDPNSPSAKSDKGQITQLIKSLGGTL